MLERARGYCEYCLMPQLTDSCSHHADHVISLKHGGKNKLENLALACVDCNQFKGPDIAAVDPLTGELTFLFNPRQQIWGEHFQLVGAQIMGLTPAGRATVKLLKLNEKDRVQSRQELIADGLYPPVWRREK
jgi:hypothetical protein